MKTRETSRTRASVVNADPADADLFADELPATPITEPHFCNEERAEDEELLSQLITWSDTKNAAPNPAEIQGSVSSSHYSGYSGVV